MSCVRYVCGENSRGFQLILGASPVRDPVPYSQQAVENPSQPRTAAHKNTEKDIKSASTSVCQLFVTTSPSSSGTANGGKVRYLCKFTAALVTITHTTEMLGIFACKRACWKNHRFVRCPFPISYPLCPWEKSTTVIETVRIRQEMQPAKLYTFPPTARDRAGSVIRLASRSQSPT